MFDFQMAFLLCIFSKTAILALTQKIIMLYDDIKCSILTGLFYAVLWHRYRYNQYESGLRG